MINLMDILRNIKDLYGQYKIWNFEKNKYKKFCSDSIKKNILTTYERDIIVLGHTLEKGLSHKNIKPKFGMNIARRLTTTLNEYIKLDNVDNFVLQNGVSILQQYILVNQSVGVPVDELPKLQCRLDSLRSSNVGAYLITGDKFFENSQEAFDKLAMSRRTMRLYDSMSESISYDKIREIVDIALNSPSACNRQAVRVHVILNPDKIKKLCDIQQGANGFGKNAGALLIISSDLRYYTMAERRLPMYDCGLFSMSLVYAAYQKKIGCCILNGSLDKAQEKKCCDIVELQPNELISSFILMNKIAEEDSFLVARSERRKVEDIIRC